MHEMDELMFGAYVHPTDNSQPYDEMVDAEAYKVTVKECLDEYNQINKTPMDLVIFTYVLEHLSKVCRMLKAEGGHGLLVGVGAGCGRRPWCRGLVSTGGPAVATLALPLGRDLSPELGLFRKPEAPSINRMYIAVTCNSTRCNSRAWHAIPASNQS